MTTFVAFIVIFGSIVFFHELGHFIVAKLAGVRVEEFSLGFGPTLFKKETEETLYSIRIIPLGGFVRLAGMEEVVLGENSDEGQVNEVSEDDPRSFNNKPLLVRMATIVAGPLMNFLLAALIFAIYFALVVIPPTITLIEPESPADIAGVQPGDQIIQLNNVKVDSTDEVIEIIEQSSGQPVKMTVKRDNQMIDLEVVPIGSMGSGRIGVQIDEKLRVPLGRSLYEGVIATGRVTRELVVSLVQMVRGKIEPELAGPIGIVQVVGKTADLGFSYLLFLAAILNVNLGLLNLLPIPVLDGGWLVLFAYEGIRGKPLKPEYRGIAQFIGLAILLLLFVFATYQDIMRLIFS